MSSSVVRSVRSLVFGLALVVSACAGQTTPEPRSPASVARSGSTPLPEAAQVSRLRFRGSDFYDVPTTLAPGEAGKLIYVEPIPASGGSVRVYRVLYHSRSVIEDRDIAVSGTIWVPAIPQPQSGYPIVTFGHGNDGSADVCANSRHAEMTDIPYWSRASALTAAGYVVAYTDYEGLGTPGPFMFAVSKSLGRSVLDAARAARELLGPAASDTVIAYGHSLGAQAVLAAGELAGSYAPELDLRGVVALAGGYDIDPRQIVQWPSSARFIQGVVGLTAGFSELKASDLLTPDAMRLLPLVEQECDLDSALGSQPVAMLVHRDPSEVPAWVSAIRQISPATAPRQTFLAIGIGEPADNVAAMMALAEKYCARSATTSLHTYRGGHDSVIGESWEDIRIWMGARISGAAPLGVCGARLP